MALKRKKASFTTAAYRKKSIYGKAVAKTKSRVRKGVDRLRYGKPRGKG